MVALPFTTKPHKKPQRPLRETLRVANKTSDYVVYGVVVLVLLIPGLIAAIIAGDLSGVLWIAVPLLLASFIYLRLIQVTLYANSMRLQNSSYEPLKEDVARLAGELKMKPVDVLATQDPAINAYALGYARPYTIVLHSGTIEKLDYNEMIAVLIHEMGHVKFYHTFLNQFLTPLQALPVVGVISTWVIGFWSRRCEYTADRLSVAYTGDPELVIRALIKVHVGPFVGEYLTKEQLMYQEATSRGMMRRTAQTLSTHPFLVNRIKAIIKFADQQGYAMADDLRQFVRRAPRS